MSLIRKILKKDEKDLSFEDHLSSIWRRRDLLEKIKIDSSDLYEMYKRAYEKDVSFYSLSSGEKDLVYRLASLRLVESEEINGEVMVRICEKGTIGRYFSDSLNHKFNI